MNNKNNDRNNQSGRNSSDRTNLGQAINPGSVLLALNGLQKDLNSKNWKQLASDYTKFISATGPNQSYSEWLMANLPNDPQLKITIKAGLDAAKRMSNQMEQPNPADIQAVSKMLTQMIEALQKPKFKAA